MGGGTKTITIVMDYSFESCRHVSQTLSKPQDEFRKGFAPMPLPFTCLWNEVGSVQVRYIHFLPIWRLSVENFISWISCDNFKCFPFTSHDIKIVFQPKFISIVTSRNFCSMCAAAVFQGTVTFSVSPMPVFRIFRNCAILKLPSKKLWQSFHVHFYFALYIAL